MNAGWLADKEPATPPGARQLNPRFGILPSPASYSLVGWCPPILSQGGYDNCTSHALILAMTTNKIRRGDYSLSNPFAFRSRLQLYYDQREIDGTTGSDAGATIASGLTALSTKGVAKEPTWPYTAPVTTKPSPPTYVQAATERLTDYATVAFNVAAVKDALSSGYPVVIGLHMRQAFKQTGPSGIVLMGLPTAPVIAEHCLCLVGYGAYPNTFTAANSWGPDWGEDGFCYLPEAMIGNAAHTANYVAIVDQD